MYLYCWTFPSFRSIINTWMNSLAVGRFNTSLRGGLERTTCRLNTSLGGIRENNLQVSHCSYGSLPQFLLYLCHILWPSRVSITSSLCSFSSTTSFSLMSSSSANIHASVTTVPLSAILVMRSVQHWSGLGLPTCPVSKPCPWTGWTAFWPGPLMVCSTTVGCYWSPHVLWCLLPSQPAQQGSSYAWVRETPLLLWTETSSCHFQFPELSPCGSAAT